MPAERQSDIANIPLTNIRVMSDTVALAKDIIATKDQVDAYGNPMWTARDIFWARTILVIRVAKKLRKAGLHWWLALKAAWADHSNKALVAARKAASKAKRSWLDSTLTIDTYVVPIRGRVSGGNRSGKGRRMMACWNRADSLQTRANLGRNRHMSGSISS